VIERIFAGPNIVVRSIDHDSIIASPEVDFVITPSDWVSKAYIDGKSIWLTNDADNINLKLRIRMENMDTTVLTRL
jgi:hypothetical protein